MLASAVFLLGIFVSIFEASFQEISNIKFAYLKEIYIPIYKYLFFDAGLSKTPQVLLASAGLVSSAGQEQGVSARSIPVLLYHGIVEKPDSTNVLLAAFRDQMFALKKAGWNAIGLNDFYDFVKGGKAPPAKSFLLTFDDGRKDSYYPVDPILWALDYKAVNFAIEKFSILDENNYYLTKEELRKMAASGRWSVEAHAAESHSNTFLVDQKGTLGLFFSNRLWLPLENRFETLDEFTARVVKELRTARIGLELLLGTPVTSFAFPFNNFGEDQSNFPGAPLIVIQAARSVYSLAFFQYATPKIFSQNYAGQLADPDGFLIKRIEVHPSSTPQDLLQIFERGSAKPLPYEDNFASDNGWANTQWGNVDIVPAQGLTLSPVKNGTGSAVVLDGSRAWQDYEIESFVQWPRGGNIYIWGRIKDTNNYAACNFGKKLVHVEQTLNGETLVINGQAHAESFPPEGFTASMKVSGRHVECAINGKTLAETDFLDPALNYGGIGFKTWDATPENSDLVIKSVKVRPLP